MAKSNPTAKGVPRTPEDRAKISIGQRQRYAAQLLSDFELRVTKTEACWLWRGAARVDGYGIFRSRPAHRMAYEMFVGPIAPGAVVCHRCDVKNCVRPDHLFQGTQADNMRDMAAKGRSLKGDRNPMRRPEVAAKMSESHRGVKVPSRGRPGRLKSEVERANMSAAQKGRPWSARRRAASVKAFP